MSKNHFDLDSLNNALLVSLHDDRAQKIADSGFKLINEVTLRHEGVTDAQFGKTSKGEVLGMLIDDVAEQITNPDRYQTI